jgi:hypothetical protein
MDNHRAGFGFSRPPFGYAHTLEQGAQARWPRIRAISTDVINQKKALKCQAWSVWTTFRPGRLPRL